MNKTIYNEILIIKNKLKRFNEIVQNEEEYDDEDTRKVQLLLNKLLKLKHDGTLFNDEDLSLIYEMQAILFWLDGKQEDAIRFAEMADDTSTDHLRTATARDLLDRNDKYVASTDYDDNLEKKATLNDVHTEIEELREELRRKTEIEKDRNETIKKWIIYILIGLVVYFVLFVVKHDDNYQDSPVDWSDPRTY